MPDLFKTGAFLCDDTCRGAGHKIPGTQGLQKAAMMGLDLTSILCV
jgi:hypothetical protein